MLPKFHADNFKSWAPPSRTRCPSSKPPCLQKHAPHYKPSSTKVPQPFLPRVLPFPKHQLPARPPTEVCVHASAMVPSVTSQGPRSTSPKPSILHFDTAPSISAYADHEEQMEQIPRNRTSPSSTPDLAPSRDVYDGFNASIDAPFCPGDASRYISSPSVSSCDESWRDLLQLADEQSGIPVDPMILTNNGPWGTEDERQHIHAGSDAVISETTCLYPDPPPLLRDVPAQYRHFDTYPGVQERNSCSGSPQANHSRAQVPADKIDSETYICVSDNLVEVPNSDSQLKPRKRKSQESQGPPQVRKRVRNSSATTSTNKSFSSLRSHFTSVSVNERLQFISWLFEGALPRCLSESDSEAPEHTAQPARHLAHSNNCAKSHGNSRKGMRYSSEEQDLLLKLRRDEKRPWSEVINLFSEQFPGRSSDSIKVFWSTSLKSR